MKIFDYTKHDGSPEFLDYLLDLGKHKNPFNCRYLRILPEEVGIKEDIISYTHKEGELFCLERGNHIKKCGIESSIMIKRKGKLQVSCLGQEKDFIIDIKESEDIGKRPKVFGIRL